MTKAKAKVYVQGPAYYEITTRTFKDSGSYEIVNSVQESDICVWTGGEDINPILYKEKPIAGTFFRSDRDKRDIESLEKAYNAKKFLVGICRGAQLLNVIPNGGSLWQDVDGHGSCIHPVFDTLSGKWLNPGLNSVHHQMLRVTLEAQIIAWTNMSRERFADGLTWTRKEPQNWQNGILEKDKDPEVVWYPKTQSLLVQSHPEFGHPPTTKYFFKLMDEYYWLGRK